MNWQVRALSRSARDTVQAFVGGSATGSVRHNGRLSRPATVGLSDSCQECATEPSNCLLGGAPQVSVPLDP